MRVRLDEPHGLDKRQARRARRRIAARGLIAERSTPSVWWVPSVVDPANPTLAELTAGRDLSQFLTTSKETR